MKNFRFLVPVIFVFLAFTLILGCTSSSHNPANATNTVSKNTGESSTNNPFIGEWHVVASSNAGNAGFYYSVQNDSAWSEGYVSGDGTRSQSEHGTYTFSGNTAHFISVNFPNEPPYNITINETGFINFYYGEDGNGAPIFVTYAKVSEVPYPPPKISYTVTINQTQPDYFYLNTGTATFSGHAINYRYSYASRVFLYDSDGNPTTLAGLESFGNVYKMVSIKTPGNYSISAEKGNIYVIDITE